MKWFKKKHYEVVKVCQPELRLYDDGPHLTWETATKDVAFFDHYNNVKSVMDCGKCPEIIEGPPLLIDGVLKWTEVGDMVFEHYIKAHENIVAMWDEKKAKYPGSEVQFGSHGTKVNYRPLPE